MKENRVTVIRNMDNEQLMPGVLGDMIIGYVDQINGEQGKEIQGFIPTRGELLQLVKYWMNEKLRDDWFYFNTGNTGSSEWRLNMFARRRINRIASLIGEKETNEAINEAFTEFREKYGSNMKLWQIFRRGDESSWEEVMGEYDRIMEIEPESENKWAFAPDMELTSKSFREGGSIPDIYSFNGGNSSPPLTWSQPPEGTHSITIIMCNLDSSGGAAYWIIFNIPPDCTELQEGIKQQGQLGNGALQGENVYLKTGYHGPHRTSPVERYQFKVYALDQTLNLPAGVRKNQILDEMETHVLGEGRLTAIYNPSGY